MSLSYQASFLPVDRSSIKNKSCLVTGAASGLGLAIAQAFASAGAYVHMVDVTAAERGREIAAGLPGGQDRVFYQQCDVTRWEDQVRAFKAAIQSSPRRAIDVVIICAGVAADFNLVDKISAQSVDLEADPAPPPLEAFQVNLIGGKLVPTVRCCHFQVDTMSRLLHGVPRPSLL